jgi:S1-C subfamily serine protease
MEKNIWEWSELYASNELSSDELVYLNNRLQNDEAFKIAFDEQVTFITNLKAMHKQEAFAAQLKKVANKKEKSTNAFSKVIHLSINQWKVAAMAASVALLTSLLTLFLVKQEKPSKQYSMLRREIETIKKSQRQLINTLQSNDQSDLQPGSYTGTAFAISREGYFITNYHVTEGSDSLYLQTPSGKYQKAIVVAYDKASDLALLKILKANKQTVDVPYAFAKSKINIGSSIFTLGYPDEEIVYKEGYISGKNGFEGDTMQYRLEMMAQPGQSGSPIIDSKGTIIGIIAGKDTELDGTTYAVSSSALMRLIASLPSEVHINLPKINKLKKLSREEQIKKIQACVGVLQVYKSKS